MTRRFAVTYDYLCGFSRNVHEHVMAGLVAGADWDVTFLPFSQVQGKADEGHGPDVWTMDEPHRASGVLALMASVAVRDQQPDRFFGVHEGLFAARHDDARNIRDEAVIRDVVRDAGADADAVWAAMDSGVALDTVRRDHEHAVVEYEVWGVPTLITAERAVFVRLLHRPTNDVQDSITQVEQLLDLADLARNLHEFKQTDLPF